ncbi:MAG TPA: hypothetical protein VKI17_02820 [Gemmataceae bacterium]|nr:hypothetical protein [Gemmataceae bacterium]
MFTFQDVQARLREKPFRPFRIVVSEGQRFDIRHPDLVLVGMNDLIIGFPAPGHPTIYSGVTRVALLHVVSLEDLPAPIPGDGQQQA